ncbi:MAG TPA: bis(5'-nucleosyl)-tetraphosphatase (symmetrical) YqeK [Verrucomicrobiae bacterium]|nr:bis(5'-nucleosyl)-tetraphosphatase (symmetrical) YqeK [Verrucomicrobiae bacterium]
MSYTQLARAVRAHLDQDHRYRHCVRVARSADILAQIHGVDPRKARLASMLHDLARLYSTEQLIDECERRKLPIDDFERRNPIVLHAPLGAALARERFGIEDAAVLSAIAKHTLGAEVMSPLDCVVYLADALEPGRDFANRRKIWELARVDLGVAMAAAIADAFVYLASLGREPAPQTLAMARVFDPSISQGVAPSLN